MLSPEGSFVVYYATYPILVGNACGMFCLITISATEEERDD